jgi:hypothetical protein
MRLEVILGAGDPFDEAPSGVSCAPEYFSADPREFLKTVDVAARTAR